MAKRARRALRAGPAVVGVDQGQVRQAPGVRGRRVVGGPGRPLGLDRLAGRRLLGLDPETGSSTGRLHYVGLVGSGLSGDMIRQLTAIFERTARDDSPFAEKLIGKLHYVEPLLIVEVAFNEITESATLRQPSLQGFRSDLNPNEVLADPDLQVVIDQRPLQVRIRQMW